MTVRRTGVLNLFGYLLTRCACPHDPGPRNILFQTACRYRMTFSAYYYRSPGLQARSGRTLVCRPANPSFQAWAARRTRSFQARTKLGLQAYKPRFGGPGEPRLAHTDSALKSSIGVRGSHCALGFYQVNKSRTRKPDPEEGYIKQEAFKHKSNLLKFQKTFQDM